MTVSWIIGHLVDRCNSEVSGFDKLSKAKQKAFVVDALTYNVVTNEIVDMVDYLINQKEDLIIDEK